MVNKSAYEIHSLHLSKEEGGGRPPCPGSHSRPPLNILECRRCLVYRISFSCGRLYVGETGRCWKSRVYEHMKQPAGNVRDHVTKCGCHIVLSDCVVLRDSLVNTHFRKLVEHRYIQITGEDNISESLIKLSVFESMFLDMHMNS